MFRVPVFGRLGLVSARTPSSLSATAAVMPRGAWLVRSSNLQFPHAVPSNNMFATTAPPSVAPARAFTSGHVQNATLRRIFLFGQASPSRGPLRWLTSGAAKDDEKPEKPNAAATTSSTLSSSSSSSTASSSSTPSEEERKAWRERIEAEERENAERAREAAMQPPPTAKSTFGRFKELWHKYGWVFVATYIAVYLSTWFSIYVLLTTPWIADLSFMQSINEWGNSHLKELQEKVTFLKRMNINVAIAWVLTKPTEPVRAMVTLAITPAIARLLGRVPPNESFRSSLRLSGRDAAASSSSSSSSSDSAKKMAVNLVLAAMGLSATRDKMFPLASQPKQ
jgi:hypothetical protein